jgi:voltage-gated potassium channel
MRSGEWIVRFCLFIDSSGSYQRLKSFFRDLLENDHAPQKRYFDLFMILLVLASVFMLIYDVGHPVTVTAALFEDFAVSVFIVEYLMRLWVYNDSHQIIIDQYERARFLNTGFRQGPAILEIVRRKWEFISSPMAIIDLLAILPSYRPIRLLRVFLLFRLFKLFRYTRSARGMASILAEKRIEFYTLALFMSFVLLASSSAIYLFEGDLPDGRFNSFFDAVYWSMITLSTVGYGDITPQTSEGRVIAMALIISGIGVVAFSTSIVVSAFQERMSDLRERRVLGDLDRMRGYTVICGYGRVGQVVVERLAAGKAPFVIIDSDSERIREAMIRGYPAIHGDAASDELLRKTGIAERAARVLCITSDDVTNIFVTISARQMNSGLEIISRANRKEVINKLKLAGADRVVAPFEIVGLMASEYVGKPVAFEAIHGILSGENDVILDTLLVPGDSFLCSRSLGAVDIARYRLLLFGVITGCDSEPVPASGLFPLAGSHFYFNPPADYRPKDRDILVLVGHRVSLQHFRRLLEKGELA